LFLLNSNLFIYPAFFPSEKKRLRNNRATRISKEISCTSHVYAFIVTLKQDVSACKYIYCKYIYAQTIKGKTNHKESWCKERGT